MADLIVGGVGDVLRHVAIELLKSVDVGLTYTVGGLYSPKFLVLLPQVGFDDLRCEQKLQNRRVPLGEIGANS